MLKCDIIKSINLEKLIKPMDNQIQNTQSFPPANESNTANVPRGHGKNSIAILVILSLIFGMLGGFLGAYYVLRFPQTVKLSALAGQVSPQNQKLTLTEDSAIIDVVKKASPAVVSVVISKDLNKIPGYSLDPNQNDPFYFFFNGRQPQSAPQTPNIQEVGAGSGFFVSADGLILTNKHVVSDAAASYTVITSDGKSFDAKVLSQDPVNDLAIIKITISGAPFLSLADSSQIQIGQRVIAIGNSLGQYQNTVTSGIVSGIGRSIIAGGGNEGSEQLSGVIQTDAAINPGNSGGPLLNDLGQVIGINTAIDQQGQLVGFAIPANDVQRALASFQKNGRITQPFLGIRYVMITQTLADQQKLPKNYGALIVRGQNTTDFAVIPGSPANKAALVESDIILEVNGQKLEGNNSLAALLKNYSVGDVISLKVYDKGSEKDVKVTLGETK